MSEIATRTPEQGLGLKPTVGLRLSIGEIVETVKNGKPVTYPRKLDHFRAKPGALGQYEDAAVKFDATYGPEPKQIDDFYFLSNAVGDVLDIRRMVWGTSGLRAMSKVNLAMYPPEEIRDRIDRWDDELITFPDDKPDVGSYQLQGPDDPVIAKTKMKTYATLRGCLPRVTGMGLVTEITTTGRRSTDNLIASVVYAHGMLRGNLIGIPFRLTVRPARMRYWDQKENKRRTTEFYEIVLDTPLTMMELVDAVSQHAQLGTPQRLELPQGSATWTGPDGAEVTVTGDARFFADSPERQVDETLTPSLPADTPPDDTTDAEVIPAEAVEVIDPEVQVADDDAIQQSFFEQAAEKAQRTGRGGKAAS